MSGIERPVTVYTAYADGRIVDITTDAEDAEQHSREHGRRVYAETEVVSVEAPA